MSPASLRRVCLVGVRGVGKTTLVRSVLERLPHVEYVVGSAVLRELAGAEFARFDHLPHEVKERYRNEAIGWMEVRQAATGKHLLCDGHTSLLDESSGQVGVVFTDRDCQFFRELILLEAPLEVILRRRASDGSKRRSLDPAVIAAEQQAERASSEALARAWSIQLHHLPSWSDDEAAARLVEILSP